jgi:aspartate aminotransferase-like enzyme
VFFFQSETTRNSTPNKWFAIAPFWTSLHHSGKYLIAKPIDICLGLEYALANLPGYDGLEITLNRGTTATRVTMAELESAGIRMVAPPNPNIRSSPARAPASPVHVKRQAEYESEIESLKAQLDEANKKAKVPRSK